MLSGARAFVQPSYFESFSIVLMEAWAAGRPALVQGHCDVLLGHARRSGGAIPYFDFATFEADTVYRQRDAEGFINLNALRLKIRSLRDRRA